MRLKLTWFWLAWFGAVCLYSFLLAGIFFKSVYTVTFDKRLQQDVLQLVQTYKPTLAIGLQKNPVAMTINELIVMEQLSKDPRIAQILYVNKFGKVRWHRQAEMITLDVQDYEKRMDKRSEALWEAMSTRSAKFRLVQDQKYYDVAVPFFAGTVNKDLLGVLSLLIDRVFVLEETAKGMAQYRLGALMVALLLGGPLYFFLYYFILKPLETLQEAVDALSLKNLEWKVAARKDEYGDLAVAFETFLQKIKVEITALRGREEARTGSERQWWRGIFQVMGPGSQAIVVDEDNNVLYTNIPSTGTVSDRVHLLDVVDNQQQDILRLVGVALERPNDLVQGETLFRNQEYRVRIVHFGDDAGLKRTLIYFEPKREESEFPQIRA